MNTYAYRKQQIKQMQDTHDNDIQHTIKITGSHDNTKWLTITNTELEQIKNVLLDYRNEVSA